MKRRNILNPKLEQSSQLNLHENAFFSHEIWTELSEKDSSRKNHIPAIHPALARTYLNHVTRNGKSVPGIIIVGQHGDHSLKDAVTLFLEENSMSYYINPSNPGRILIK